MKRNRKVRSNQKLPIDAATMKAFGARVSGPRGAR